jgi:hypothetical protein
MRAPSSLTTRPYYLGLNFPNDGHDAANHVHFAIVGDLITEIGIDRDKPDPTILGRTQGLDHAQPCISMAQNWSHILGLFCVVSINRMSLSRIAGIIDVPLLVAQNNWSMGALVNWRTHVRENVRMVCCAGAS